MRGSGTDAEGSLSGGNNWATRRPARPGAGTRAFCMVAFVALSFGARSWGQRLEPEKPRVREAAGAPAAPTNLPDLSGVDAAASRAEVLERQRALEAASGHSAPGTSGVSNAAPGAGSVTNLPRGGGVVQAASATPTSALDRAADKPLRELLDDRLRWIEKYQQTTEALQPSTQSPVRKRSATLPPRSCSGCKRS
jgi:hypothetical protein